MPASFELAACALEISLICDVESRDYIFAPFCWSDSTQICWGFGCESLAMGKDYVVIRTGAIGTKVNFELMQK